MIARKNLVFIFVFAPWVFSPVFSYAQPIPDKEAEATVVSLLKTLKSNLVQEMQKNGPLGALEFCSLQATPLTEKVNQSLKPGWSVKRISDRNRNPLNAPDEVDQEALKFFEAKGNPDFIWLDKMDDSKKLASRYYKAIKIEGTCLQCHGTNVSKQMQKILKQKYPKDKATGYRVGELRGVVRLEIKQN